MRCFNRPYGIITLWAWTCLLTTLTHAAPFRGFRALQTNTTTACQAQLDTANMCFSTLSGCGACLNSNIDEGGVAASAADVTCDCTGIPPVTVEVDGICPGSLEVDSVCTSACASQGLSFEDSSCADKEVLVPLEVDQTTPTLDAEVTCDCTGIPPVTVGVDENGSCPSSSDVDAVCRSACASQGLSFEAASCSSPLLCSNFEEDLCSAIYSECPSSCGTCVAQLEDYYECVALESGCSSFDCSTVPVTTPPINGPTDSPTTPTLAPTTGPVASPTNTGSEGPKSEEPSDNSSLNIGAIIGGAVGAVAIVCVSVIAIFYIKSRQNDSQPAKDTDPKPVDISSVGPSDSRTRSTVPQDVLPMGEVVDVRDTMVPARPPRNLNFKDQAQSVAMERRDGNPSAEEQMTVRTAERRAIDP